MLLKRVGISVPLQQTEQQPRASNPSATIISMLHRLVMMLRCLQGRGADDMGFQQAAFIR
eukprot:354869-Chlamydomonas_euryale.AAC.12